MAMAKKGSTAVHMRDGHGEGEVSSVLWDRSGLHLITAGPDTRILVHSQDPSKEPLSVLRHHRDAVTAIALSSNGKHLASASSDHSVKLYTYPNPEFQSNITRFTLPICSLAYSPTGGMLAAAGEDDGIKLITTIDNSIVRVFKGHSTAVVSLAFDPKNEYLASAGSDGTVIIWSLTSGKRLHTLQHVAPNSDLQDSCRNEISWHPKGDVLAVPGKKCDVLFYDRDTGEKLFSLKGGHSASVGFLAWSPNGKYLATAAADRQVMLWDFDKRQDFDRQKFDVSVCSLAWRPTGNALAVIDIKGRFGVWESAVPAHMTLPTDMSDSTIPVNTSDLLQFSDDDDDLNPNDISKDGMHSSEEHSDDDISMRVVKRLPSKGKDVKSVKTEEDSRQKLKSSSLNITINALQEPFQPGSTPFETGKRHFLCYNLLGSIISARNDGFAHVEVEFHDTGRGSRVPAMTDHFGFTIAALNENGSVFGAPWKGEKNASMIMYRPFGSWANNSEWSMRLSPEEDVKAVALGHGWVAAATSLHFLRIFSEGGLQKFVMSLAGPIVTMVGHEQLLAVVTHAANPLCSEEQVMKFIVLNMQERIEVASGQLPLSPGARLSWLGFTESASLSAYDSKGVLRVYSSEFNGCWIPIFSASKECKNEGENLWMVGQSSTQVYCVICKSPEIHPQVSPKPVLSVLNVSIPLASSDLGADDLENEYIRGSLLLAQMQKEVEQNANQLKRNNLDEEILKTEAELDRCLLRLIAAACKGDKLVRSLELARMLSLNKSLNGAIKLVTAMRLPALAERLTSMLEDRMCQERIEVATVRNSEKSNPKVQSFSLNNNHLTDTAVKMERSLVKDAAASPSVSDRVHAMPSVKMGEPLRSSNTVSTNGSIDASEAKNVSTDLKQGAVEPMKSSVKLASAESGKPRTNNPFGKASGVLKNTDQSSSSFLESLKKMQETEEEVKRKDNGHSRPSKMARNV